jgi:hypothetical protein
MTTVTEVGIRAKDCSILITVKKNAVDNVHYKFDIITIYISNTAYLWLQQTKHFVNRISSVSVHTRSSCLN